jgi:protease-4
MVPNLQKTMNDKLGLRVNVVGTNKHSDFISVYRPLSATEKERLQKSVEDIYSKFIDKVSTSRSLAPSEVDSLGQGRVWSGDNALDKALIDRIGGLREAIALAAERAGLSDYRTVELPKEQSSLELMMSALGARIRGKYAMAGELELALKHYEYISSVANGSGIMARMSYNVELH